MYANPKINMNKINQNSQSVKLQHHNNTDRRNYRQDLETPK